VLLASWTSTVQADVVIRIISGFAHYSHCLISDPVPFVPVARGRARSSARSADLSWELGARPLSEGDRHGAPRRGRRQPLLRRPPPAQQNTQHPAPFRQHTGRPRFHTHRAPTGTFQERLSRFAIPSRRVPSRAITSSMLDFARQYHHLARVHYNHQSAREQYPPRFSTTPAPARPNMRQVDATV